MQHGRCCSSRCLAGAHLFSWERPVLIQKRAYLPLLVEQLWMCLATSTGQDYSCICIGLSPVNS